MTRALPAEFALSAELQKRCRALRVAMDGAKDQDEWIELRDVYMAIVRSQR